MLPRPLVSLLAPPLQLLAAAATVAAASASASASSSSYDFVVVGGGTAGLVVANRLSEDANVTVAVIEAGHSVFNNPNVTDTEAFGLGLGTAIDWDYESVPQKYAGGGTQPYHAGKALGGTSTINGMTYLRAQTVQIDAWEALGNAGWNWASLYPYYKKSERLEPPTPSQAADGAAYDAAFHAFDGPLDVGWQAVSPQNGSATAIVNQTWANLGMPYNEDANGGSMRGFNVWPFTVNAKTSVREDAARAYYYPVAGRPNLHVYLNTTATRLVWKDDGGEKDCGLVAGGVEVVTSAGEVRTVRAAKEVVISLGSLRTPLMLEFSGVGNPAILNKFSIPVRIALPGVGENMQDQTNVPLVATTAANDTTFLGYPPYVTYTTASDLFGANLSAVESTVRTSIPSYAALNVAASNNASTLSAQEHLLTLQANLIFNNAATLPIAEILTATFSASNVIELPTWALLPFGRGSVHIASTNPYSTATGPAINPNFFMNPFDNAVQIAASRFARRAFTTPPLSHHVAAQSSPSLQQLPLDAPDDAWLAFLKSAYGSNSHPLGTAAMMSRALGGVVDAALKVHGTANVRVVDASVLPWQVCGHLSSTVYAVAERAADLIRGRVAVA